MSSPDLDDMAWDLASDGFAGREAAVLHVVRAARAAGISTPLTAILSAARQPDVARHTGHSPGSPRR